MKIHPVVSVVRRGVCVAAVLGTMTASAKTLALYTFEDGTVGEAVTSGSLVNAAPGGAAYKASVGAFGKVGDVSFTTAPAYTNDVPGRYIYSSGLAESLVTEKPKAVWFSTSAPDASSAGGYIQFSNLGRDIANATNFTVEMFVKFAADDAKQWRSAYTFQTHNTLKLCNPSLDYIGIQNTTIVNKGGDLTYSPAKRGQWRHIAVTCQRDEYRAKMYFDGVYKGYVTFTNLTDTAKTDGVFTLGGSLWGNTEAMYGGVACLRVSDRVLEPVEFMVASNEPLETPRTDKTLGLWTFKDGAPGTPAATLANAALPGVYEGRVLVTNGTAAAVTDTSGAPRFSNDVPGENLYDGLAGRVCGKRVQSLEIPYVTGADHGLAVFPALSRQLSLQESFTIETFAKVDRRQTASTLWSVLFMGTCGEQFKLCIPSRNKTNLAFQNVTQNTTIEKSSTIDLGENGWRHYAVVYDGATGKASLYCDYVKVAYGQIDALDIARAPLGYSAPFIVGSQYKVSAPYYDAQYPFFGKICGLRVTARALAPDQLLRAAGCAETRGGVQDGATAHWALDDEDGFTYGYTENRRDLDPKRRAYGRVENRGTKPRARPSEIDTRHPFVYSGTRLLHRNLGCAWFEGGRYYDKSGEQTFDSWKGDALRWDSATNAWRNPKSFTVELFARGTNEWINTNTRNKLIMGREGAGDMSGSWYYCWENGRRVPYARNWCRYTWRVTMTSGGQLQMDTKWHHFTDDNHDGTNDVETISDDKQVMTKAGQGVNMRDNKWHHIAFVYDDATWTAKLYYDHREVLSYTNPTHGLARMECSTEFGRGLDQSGFDGSLDEIRLTPRVLRPEEMLYMRKTLGSFLILR